MKTLALIFLAACQASAAPSQPAQPSVNAQGSGSPQSAPLSASAAPSQPRNLVCERLSLENGKAPCVPELTDAGELHTHTARITIDGQTIVCALNSAQVSVVCGPMFMAQQKQEQPAAPPAKK